MNPPHSAKRLRPAHYDLNYVPTPEQERSQQKNLDILARKRAEQIGQDAYNKQNSPITKIIKTAAKILFLLGIFISSITAIVFVPLSAVVKTGLICGTVVGLIIFENNSKRNYPDDDNYSYKKTKPPATADVPIHV